MSGRFSRSFERTTAGFKSDVSTSLRRAEPRSIIVFEGWATVDKLKYEWKKLRKSQSFSRFEDVESGRELRLTFHDFRHACATFLHERGMSLDEIKEMLGHSSIRVTERYYANTGRAVTRDRLNKIHGTLNMKPE